MSEGLLNQILEANRCFLSGSAKPIASEGDPFIVIACIDPRLTELLEPALGLPRHRGIVIRTSGNVISENSPEALRSVAAGLYLKNAKEIFVAGHTDCAMARFLAQDVIESFRSAGVSRGAFGNADLRAWFGAFSDIRANVLQGIAYLRKSGIVPSAVKVHGLLLDSASGAAELLFEGSAPDSIPAMAPIPEVAAPAPPSPALPAQREAAPALRSAETRSSPPSMSMEEIVASFRKLYAAEHKNRQFQIAMGELALVLKKERDPRRILNALNRAVAPFSGKYPECRKAIEELTKWNEMRGPSGLNLMELVRQVFGQH
jgi:carbonic anhydrase